MTADKGNGMMVDFGSKRVYINAYHIRITDAETKKVLFERGRHTYGNLDWNWLDDKHTKITKALKALETALIEACKPTIEPTIKPTIEPIIDPTS
jgi:hypothetical protein